VRGTVVRVSNIKPLVTQMAFSCGRCEAEFEVRFVDGKYKLPTKCTTSGCRSRTFFPNKDTAKMVDSQNIRLQELETASGRVPRSIEIDLEADLVDCCVPGDVITVAGIVKAAPTQIVRTRGKGKAKSLYLCYIYANSIANSKEMDTSKLAHVSFSNRELEGIREIAQFGNVLGLLVHSLCPTIYGNECVKAGLLLALFGGRSRREEGKNKVGVRGDIHVLLVGDPGLGKSQMLRAVTNIAPRGIYVTATYASGAGLTVTLHRESGTGDYALEGGALVLADQGIRCALFWLKKIHFFCFLLRYCCN